MMNIPLAAKKAVVFAALMLAAFTTLAGAATAAHQTSWVAQQVVTAVDSTSRIRWTADTPSGTVVGIWRLDAAGRKIGSGPVYGPYTSSYGNWSPQQLVVARDGTCRLLWVASDDDGTLAVVWTLTADGTVTSYGKVYGPFSDVNGDWSPQDLEVARDGSSRLLWVNINSMNTGVEVGIWNLDANGIQTAQGPVYGPYFDNRGANWEPYQLVVAPDGSSRLLWVVYGDNGDTSGHYTGDTVGIWKFDVGGSKTGSGPAYGPFAGWGVANFDLNTSDGSLRMLWDNFGTYNGSNTYSGDIAGVWSFDTNGTETTIGQIYGPFTGWSADAIAALPDGTSRVEWSKTVGKSDVVGFWGFDAGDRESFIGPTYGPFNGWTLGGADINRSDNSFRLLWNRDDDAAGLWSLNSGGTETAIGTVYGPYTYSY